MGGAKSPQHIGRMTDDLLGRVSAAGSMTLTGRASPGKRRRLSCVKRSPRHHRICARFLPAMPGLIFCSDALY